jgi:gliding motility-associated-like protein
MFSPDFLLGNKTVFLSILLFIVFSVKAQINLVPNGSFEEYNWCPVGIADFSVSDWNLPTGGSSDYFNACNDTDASVPVNLAGNQVAHTGYAYCGIANGFENPNKNQREYIQTQLLSELITGKEYVFTGFFSLAENSRYCLKNLGFALSNIPIGGSFGSLISFSAIQIFPQSISFCNMTDWIEVQVNYIAQGGEKYLTIGLFFDDINSQIELVNPQKEDFAYYYIDDISIKEVSLGKIPNVFTPNNDELNDFWEFSYLSDVKFYILNRWGQTIYNGVSTSNIISWDGKSTDGNECSTGIYFYKIIEQSNIKTGFIHLIR